MPWEETRAVSERHHLIKLIREGISVSEASRTRGSREAAFRWLWLHCRWGAEGYSDRSRGRHRQEHETPASVRRLPVALRKETGAGPRRLLFLSRSQLLDDRLPAVITVNLTLRK
jgi:hypothetical protein